jgi:hypothetical protein
MDGAIPSLVFEAIREALAEERVHVSEHAYDEALEDGLDILEVIESSARGGVIEDYPDDPRGASCLVLLRIGDDEAPAHAVWGYNEASGSAVLVTVYRPDERRWSADYRKRRAKT